MLLRLAFVAVIVIATITSVHHRRNADRTGGSLLRSPESRRFLGCLRVSAIANWCSVLVYLLYPPAVAWASLPLPRSLRWAGFVSATGCVGLMSWTLSSLGRNLADAAAIRSQAQLVTTGPYRWIRHPYYVTTLLLMTSATVLTANGLVGLTSLLVLALLFSRTPHEEAMLIQRFGDEYRAYATGTNRFFPSWKSIRGR